MCSVVTRVGPYALRARRKRKRSRGSRGKRKGCKVLDHSKPPYESVQPLVSRNYKVHASVRLGKSILKPLNTILDTDCGPNLIRASELPSHWTQHLLPDKANVKLHSANKSPLKILGTIRLVVQLGPFCVRTQFLVIPNLAVACILGIAYASRYVRSIRCMERKVELLDGSVIAIQEVHGASTGSNEAPPTNPDPSKPISNKVRVAQAVILPRLSET